jgi:NodT family efflux transporter outer membrane factor (OMF) lipoprotein
MLGAACMVGPDYARPEVDLAATWSAAAGEPTQPDAGALWWQQFHDPVLEHLIAAAFAQNLTLRQAGLRVIQARALRGLAAGEFFPQVQAATGEASAQRLSRNTPLGSANLDSYETYAVGLQAVWELDFWGKFRRGIESADAALEASVADYDAFLVALAAEVATQYVAVRSLQERLELTRGNVRVQSDTLELTRVRHAAGAVSELDVATARATLANTQSSLPVLEDELRQATLALCVLLGRAPDDLAADLAGTAVVPTPPAAIALGVPADLLRRRPDVRAAERQAAALSAQIGVAKADFYPAVSLTGSTGFRVATFRSSSGRSTLGNLFDADSFEGFVGLGVQWSILDYGRIANNVRAADARFEEAKVAYQQSVLAAAADVEAGLSHFLRSREQAAALAESATAAQRAQELALIQYRQGAADFLRVNQALVDLVERQNLLALARAQVALGAIATFRSLGGGWEVRGDGEFVPPATVEAMRARTDWGDVLSPDYAAGSDAWFARPGNTPNNPEPERQP